MKKNKDSIGNQLVVPEIQNLVACYALLGVDFVDINVPMDDNSIIISHGTTPGPRTIEVETQTWCDIIHAQLNFKGQPMNVMHRGPFNGIENNYGFGYDKTTPMGTASSAATDGNATWCGRWYRYLYNHVGNHVISGDIFSPIPEGTTHTFDGNWFAASQAAYAQLLIDMHTITTAYAASKGVTVTFVTGQNFSECASGWMPGSVFADQGMVGCDYYGQRQGASKVEVADYIRDWQQLYLGLDSSGGGGNACGGYNQAWMEWGDLVSGVPANIKTIQQRQQYLKNLYKAMRDQLVTPNGHMIMFCYWGGWEGQDTSLLYKTGSGASSQYFLNARGQMLASFFRGESGTVRIPVVRTGNSDDTYAY